MCYDPPCACSTAPTTNGHTVSLFFRFGGCCSGRWIGNPCARPSWQQRWGPRLRCTRCSCLDSIQAGQTGAPTWLASPWPAHHLLLSATPQALPRAELHPAVRFLARPRPHTPGHERTVVKRESSHSIWKSPVLRGVIAPRPCGLPGYSFVLIGEIAPLRTLCDEKSRCRSIGDLILGKP